MINHIKTIWMFYRLTWNCAWCDKGTEQRQACELLRDSLAGFMTRSFAESRFWVVWLFVLWLLGPFALVYNIVRLCIRDYKWKRF
jgi:hypothetical protein